MIKTFVAVLLLCFFSPAMPAQDSAGDVAGTVTDKAGAVIANADVRIVNSQQIVLAAAKTDVQGRFRFVDIPFGSYVIIASRADFGSRSEAIKVSDQDVTDLSLVLAIGQLSAEVTVTAETGQAESKDKIPQQINLIADDAI